jgi:hypothetical protein
MTSERDLELLRAFEPVIRYTQGELFFPMAADRYIAGCDLWVGTSQRDRRLLAAAGRVNAENLAGWQEQAAGGTLFLRYVQQPLSGVDLARWQRRSDRPRFHAPSRLARAGIVARLIDAGFDLSLLLRGTVPGGTAAAAERKYAASRAVEPAPRYHGRVVRQAGWTVCHYLFFYAMNDWRSTFSGANDHEADWEQCFVFLEETAGGGMTPVWFARAAHDEVGADLRRRWDDPLLQRVGDHPVMFAGAGSHAGYIEPGEYLQSVPIRLPSRLSSLADGVGRFWRETLRQGGTDESGESVPISAVPFVDYARGDGLAVGPGQDVEWVPILVDDTVPWVSGYQGLWGLDTYDRFAGERAPAGPKFGRDGRPRQSWIDPVGFAGLEHEPPPGSADDILEARIASLEVSLASTAAEVESRASAAQSLGIAVTASRRAGRSEAAVAAASAEAEEAVAVVRSLRREQASIAAALDDCRAELERVRRGDPGDPRAHLRHVVHPQDPHDIRRSRLLDLWSALSVGLAILILAAVLFTDADRLWSILILIFGGYVVIEAAVRRRLLQLLLDITILLAVVASLVLIASHLTWALAGVLLVVGLFILRDNLRELRSGFG